MKSTTQATITRFLPTGFCQYFILATSGCQGVAYWSQYQCIWGFNNQFPSDYQQPLANQSHNMYVFFQWLLDGGGVVSRPV